MRIGGDLDQGFGAGVEQKVVEDLLVLQNQSGEVVGKREDDVEIRDGKQVPGSLRQPLLAGVGLAFWAMPISTRVIRDGLMAASGTPVQVAAESCRAAVPDGAQHF